ncbi:MAG: phosphomannomutase/phosphoglucomutase, partial [Syntrophobacteraceae bacterium]|nr:phosphomannomutase/phosphoglucomutase [Syntrophobacteraceae bacterium]
MEPKAFREYDIRGRAGKDILDGDVVRMGRTFATYMRQQGRDRIVVGRDCRLTSKPFRDLLIQGLLAGGMDVVDIGVCPTPLLYFALRHLEREGGIMITASHNPPEYNGFKICNDFSTISGEEIQKLRRLMESGEYADGRGKLNEYDIRIPYTDFVLSNIRITKTLKVGLDAGNSVGGPVALPLLEKLGCEVHPLYCDMDGTFPNHEPDPTQPDNLKDHIAKVRETKADLGIAFDGDADRIGAVDGLGRILWGDQLMIIFARDILLRHPGATVISEVKASEV